MRTLTVLKGFTEGGKYFAPGDPAPAKLHPTMVEKLIRTRHLWDAKAKLEPVVKNELKVVKNDREDWVITPNANPSAPEGHQYTRGYASAVPSKPAVGGAQYVNPESQATLGRDLAQQQNWDAPARLDTASQPGTVIMDKGPSDPLAGRKLAATQDWKE